MFGIDPLVPWPALSDYTKDTDMSDKTLPDGESQWKKVTIAKSAFARSGEGAYTWADVQAMRLKIKTNEGGAVNVKFDNLKMLGGAGLQGRYKYLITYYNSLSGNRSNANATKVKVKAVHRQTVLLTNIPKPPLTQSQVDYVEIWRTVGDGGYFFKVGEIPAVDDSVSTLSFLDTVADGYLLDPRSGVEYLSSLQLPTDNAPPLTSFEWCTNAAGTVFWINRETPNTSGNLYYSAIGRAEAMKGYIRTTLNAERLRWVGVWNATVYVFSIARLFKIAGIAPPYTATLIQGVPGTDFPQTVVPTPHGIVYWAGAGDGLRLFNGIRSERIGWPQMGRVFGGDASTASDIPAFTTPKCAAYGKNEYFISDGTQTFAYHLLDDTWRDIGMGFNCLYYYDRELTMFGGNDDGVYKIEAIGETIDSGNDYVPFEVETPQARLDVDKETMVNYIFLDANTNGQSLEIIVVGSTTVNNATVEVEELVGMLTTTGRQSLTVVLNRQFNRIGIRLKGSITAPVEVFGIELDVDMPTSHLQEKYQTALRIAG